MYTDERADLLAGEPEITETEILDYFQRLAVDADELHACRAHATLGAAYDAFADAAARIPKHYSDLMSIDAAHDLGGIR